MTVASQTARNQYTTNGVAVAYPYTFKIQQAGDLKVIRRSAAGVESVLTLNTHYSVSGAGDAAGGTVTLVSAGASGETLSIVRDVDVTQQTAFTQQGSNTAANNEAAHDKRTMVEQELKDGVLRSLRVPQSYDPASVAMEVRPETGKVLGWTGASTLGNVTIDTSGVVLPAGGRTVATTSAYLANNAVWNILDFGAVSDPTFAADSTAAIQAALNAARAAGGGTVLVPPGVYNFTALSMKAADALPFRNVHVVGLAGSPASDSSDITESYLICTAVGSGTGIDLASAQGCTFRNLKVGSRAGHTGTLVKTGHAAMTGPNDPTHLVFDNVRFVGPTTAAALLDLEWSLLVTVRDCGFSGGTRAIVGHQGNYSNVVLISRCEFVGSLLAPILQPGESWAIENCAFEPLSGGGAGAVDLIAGTYFNYGFRYVGNWHGDVNPGAKVWVTVRPLGGVIQGNFAQVEGTDTFCLIKGGAVGVHVTGNRVTQGSAGAIGLDFEATVDSPIVEGNSFQCDVPIQNDLANTMGGRIANNINVTVPRPMALNSATPSVGSATAVVTNTNTPTTITNFAQGRNGQHVFVQLGTNDTIQHNGFIHTNGGGNITGAVGMVVGFLRIGSLWHETSRVTAT